MGSPSRSAKVPPLIYSTSILTLIFIFRTTQITEIGTLYSRPQRLPSFWSAPRIATSGLHSGQTTERARDLSSSGPFRFRSLSRDGMFSQIHRLQHVTTQTVRQFANEILLGIFLFVDKSLP